MLEYEAPSVYLERLRHQLSFGLLDRMVAVRSLVVVGARGEQDQTEAWVQLFAERGIPLSPPPPPPALLPGRSPCARHPACMERPQVQVWCLGCWEAIEPPVQRKLLATYREGQGFDGDVKEWMAWAMKTPRA